MYHHLLVPVDGSDLSIQIIGQAVEFAAHDGGANHVLPRGAGPWRLLRSETEVVWATPSSNDDYPFEGRRAKS